MIDKNKRYLPLCRKMPVTIAEDIKEILKDLKKTLLVMDKMGYAVPAVSTEALGYLESGISAPPCRPLSSNGRESDRPDDMETLREELGDCRRCKLHKTRKNIVFGEGSDSARLVFVGEGPGRNEDIQGRPFVGEAGEMLSRIIRAMGLTRRDVFICNVVKCRPPANRDPERDEIETCMPFLKRQLSIIRPEVICTLGRVSTQALLGKDFRITRERGKWRSYEGIPLMPTFHPAYILRNKPREKELKGQVWDDVQMIMKRMGLEVKRNAK